MRPASGKSHDTSERSTLAAVVAGALVSFDVSALNTAGPSLQHSFGLTIAEMQWAISIYALAFAALLLAAGTLVDGFGQRTMFLTGLGVFMGASLGCALATTWSMLLVGRAAQGAGAALLMPAAMSWIASPALAEDARMRAVAWWGAAGSAALALGPVLGGALVESAGWRSVLLVNLPVGALGFWMGALVRERPRVAGAGGPGVLNQALAMLALVCTALSFELLAAGGHNRAIGSATGIAAVVSAALFALRERTAERPTIPPAVWRDAAFLRALLVGSSANLVFYGLLFVLSLFLQIRLGAGAATAGLLLSPLMITLFAAHLSAPRLRRWLPVETLMASGMATAALGFLGLLAATLAWSPWRFAGASMVLAGGIALSVTSSLSSAFATLPGDVTGTASGLLNSARQLGGALGVALSGAVLAVGGDGREGYGFCLGAAAIVCAIVSILTHFPTRALRGAPIAEGRIDDQEIKGELL